MKNKNRDEKNNNKVIDPNSTIIKLYMNGITIKLKRKYFQNGKK